MSEEFRDRLRTVDERGHRLQVYAEIIDGAWRIQRKRVAYFLIALLFVLPLVTKNGVPLLQLDVLGGRLFLGGQVFWFHETGFFIPFILAIALLIYALTAWAGRVICGWTCPQTVFLEFVYRPIEVWLEGHRSRTRKEFDARPMDFDKFWRKSLKWFLYFIISFLVGNIFLSYFIGMKQLLHVIQQSPAEHPGMFFLVSLVTAAFTFNFGWFREQMCTITCPYGRLQGVLLDRQSAVVGYDYKRGEPRGRGQKGDCVDCFRCVQVCPTGIDIRDGTQLECVNCMACIDACNEVMTKLGRSQDLIKRTTEAQLAGESTKGFQKRPLIYGFIVLALFVFAGFQGMKRSEFDVTVLRSGAVDFQVAGDDIENHVRLKINNKLLIPLKIHIEPGQKEMHVIAPQNGYVIPPNNEFVFETFVKVEKEDFKNGKAHAVIRITGSAEGKELDKNVSLTLFGPN